MPRARAPVMKKIAQPKHRSHRNKTVTAISLEMLLRNLPGAVYRRPGQDHGTMEFISAGIEKLTGYPPSTFTGRTPFTFASIIDPSDRARVSAETELAVAAHKSFQVIYRIAAANGDTKWLCEQGAAVFGADGTVVALEGFVADITETKRLNALVSQQAALLDKAREAICVVDMDCRITYWNEGASRLFGWSASQVIGQHYGQLVGINPHQFRAAFDATVSNGVWEGECVQHAREGRGLATEARWTLVRFGEAEATPPKIFMIGTDISERKNSDAKIYRLAFFDALTGLPNRANMLDQLRSALTLSARDGTIGALLLCDLDNFKALNELRGHAAGDLFLRAVARRLEHSVRATDVIARLGSDEFVILLLPRAETFAEVARRAEAVAETVIARLVFPIRTQQDAHSVTTSIGVTLFRGTDETIESVFMKAEAAMRQAKAAGKSRARFYDPETQASIESDLRMELALNRAIADHEFVLYYQPQVNSRGEVTGAEALIRWRKNGQLLLPSEFIRFAEATGQIVEIGKWALSAACHQLAEWSRQPALADLSLALNISARQFVESDFVSMAEAVFATSGANLGNLKLELTENLLVSDIAKTAEKMEHLKRSGITFSLDDFGTGYSSLAYLRKLPLDQLKIDYLFMRDVLVNQDDAAIVRLIIALAQSLGLEVIAEGVETEGQRQFLDNAGCHAFQGFLYARALPNDRFVQYVSAPR